MRNTMMNPKTVQIVSRKTVVRQPGEGKRLEPPMGPQVVKVSRMETEGAFEIIELEVVHGMGAPLHLHPGFDEAFYVLEGVLTARIGDDIVDLPAGASAIVPAGTVHTWTNRGERPVRFLQFTAPGSMEELLEALAARPVLSLEEVTQLADLYGTTILGPPM